MVNANARPVISFGGHFTVIRLRLSWEHFDPKMASSLRRQFGIRLKAIRHERELTQEEFAELVGISVDFLSLIERGVNAPSFEVLERIGARLHLPVQDLFDFNRTHQHSKR